MYIDQRISKIYEKNIKTTKFQKYLIIVDFNWPSK